jgi:polyphosphate:AMP phosphotransferase
MFESAELGHTVDKATWDAAVPGMREALLRAQNDVLEKATFPIVVVIGGVDGAGKGETVNLLNAWLDPRHVRTHAMGERDDAAPKMPRMWRFWRALPAKGQIGIFMGSWYTAPIVRRVYGDTKRADLDRSIDVIRRFERMLLDDGACVVKLWFHLSKRAQRARLKSLEKDPDTRWRVNATDWKNFALYDDFRAVSERVLRETSTGRAPWIVIEGTDARFRELTAATALRDAMTSRLRERHPVAQANGAAPLRSAVDGKDLLGTLDLTKTLAKRKYDRDLERWQGTLNRLSRHSKLADRSLVLVFEGLDASGKGGAIRRVTGALDARRVRVVPIAAPTEEERAYPYLWRFWRDVPAPGHIAIFDRSWYGRVLVERVEGLASGPAWMRAYQEICDFENELVSGGAIVVKIWLAVSKAEQLRRFREREKMGWKRFKITAEDWRNRKKWREYEAAANDMFDRTSTAMAPWTIIPAVDKEYARIKVLETICRGLEDALD